MRLQRLDLLRYGHFADVSLDFPGGPGLHVVLGANEAGKSTALAAVADALFGFGHRTDFDFLHGSAQLRVGLAVCAADGAQAYFVRRKGRSNTLREADDQPLAEESLRRFLGGIGRERFEQGFGLDGARLRQGGEALLRSGGEAGESLLAGGGLLGVRPALARLDEEARSLVGDGRGRRRLSDAVESWRAAARDSEARAVAPRAWQEAEAERVRAETELARLQSETRALAAEASRLQRARRVAPLLAGLGVARARLAALADAPPLGPDAETRLAALLEQRRQSARDVERETTQAATLAAQRRALPQEEAVLSMQDAIDALSARRPVASQAAEDLPAARARIAVYRARALDALADLGVLRTVEAARDGVPGAGPRRRVQQLVSRHSALAATVTAAAEALRVLRTRRDRAAAAQAGGSLAALPATHPACAPLPAPASPAMLRRTLEQVRGEGPLEAELARARSAADGTAAVVASALSALPLWSADLDGLLACRMPLPAQCEESARHLEAASLRLSEALAAETALASEITSLEEDVSRLARGEAVPTPAAVTAARRARDRAWRLIRRMREDGTREEGPLEPADVERDGLPPGPLPDVFEVLRDTADALADRRADEAQRVADFLTATARLELLRERRPRARQSRADAAAASARAEADWQALWTQSGVMPASPAAMAEWRRARAEIVRLAGEAAAAQARHDELRARCERAGAALAGVLPAAAAAEAVAAMLLRAETLCAALERDEATHRAQVEALAREDQALAEAEQAALAAEAALAGWRADWTPAVAALGLPGDAAVETMEAVLGAWGRIAEIAPAWRADEQRVIDMAANLADFANEAAALRAALGAAWGEPAAEETAATIALRLQRRLEQARRSAAEAESLAARIASHQAAAAEAADRLQRAEADLQALRDVAGAADDDALRQAMARARARDAASTERAGLERALLAQGDGLDEAALDREAAALDVDAAAARLAEIDHTMATLGEQRELASAARTRAQTLLAEMLRGHDAASKAQEAEDALAEARAVAERYARLHVAQALLRAGIERFRAQQQAPLLRAAGQHFALLTGGRYRGLAVDQDDAGRTMLLALRDGGAECPVQALSEGTRDQLYLSLRVATIESYAAHSEPLPFIADDLLVQFDDTRARAAIALLAQLGAVTQVILFTHHDHIAALAAEQNCVSVQRMTGREAPAA